jgi:hypothetical protein
MEDALHACALVSGKSMTEPHDPGLARDILALERAGAERRRMLAPAGRCRGSVLVGCGGEGDGASATVTPGTTATCSVIPCPADGSNTVGGSIANALALSGIVRSDLRSRFAGAGGSAAGVAPTCRSMRKASTMSSISSVSSYGSNACASVRTQRPDPAQMSQDLFKKIDANGDGSIGSDEFSNALQSGMPPPPPGGMGGPPPMSTEDFARSRSDDDSTATGATSDSFKDPSGDFELRALSVLATLANAQHGAVAANAADGAGSNLLAAA